MTRLFHVLKYTFVGALLAATATLAILALGSAYIMTVIFVASLLPIPDRLRELLVISLCVMMAVGGWIGLLVGMYGKRVLDD